ncbi:hypothetical protein GCM10020254_54420 [Streptomyces goshikiensis]
MGGVSRRDGQVPGGKREVVRRPGAPHHLEPCRTGQAIEKVTTVW